MQEKAVHISKIFSEVVKANLLNASSLCLELNEQSRTFFACGQVANTVFELKSVICLVNHGKS